MAVETAEGSEVDHFVVKKEVKGVERKAVEGKVVGKVVGVKVVEI